MTFNQPQEKMQPSRRCQTLSPSVTLYPRQRKELVPMRSVASSTKCRPIIQQTVLLAAVFMLMSSFSLSLVQAQSCTVFGNPPRGNVFAVEPFCGTGGWLLGGLSDSDGTPRSAW